MTHTALIVAHGSPSDPDTQEAALQELAKKVQARLPGWKVRGATLSAKGTVEAAIQALHQPLIYPFFMAQGYFTKRVLAPMAQAAGLHLLPPFGVEPTLPECAAALLEDSLRARGWHAHQTALLLAAHGSAVSRTSADSTRAMESELAARLPFRLTRSGFIEEPPHVVDQARDLGQAICLNFFATNAGHMLEDMPAALEEARFTGPVLPAMIDWPETPTLIAASLERAASPPSRLRPDRK